MQILTRIAEIFERRGDEKYADEEVTQLQHALQCAVLAAEANAGHAQVAAALLHDIGHILGEADLPPSCKVDLHDHHEKSGQSFLEDHFVKAVSEPVRLHVAAKRYLCTKNPDYQSSLSPTSLKSFHDQGGLFSASELAEFEQEEFFEEAIELRHWDDLAKSTQTPAVNIATFFPQLESSLLSKVTSSNG